MQSVVSRAILALATNFMELLSRAKLSDDSTADADVDDSTAG
jgi:hypothetical protein